MYHLAISLLSYLSTLEGEAPLEPSLGEAPLGPQTAAEIAQARSALHGRFYGGDMIFQGGIPSDVSHGGIKDKNLRWSGYPGKGVIPYKIDSSVSQHTDLIKKAMDQYHKLTCIRFVPRKKEKNYVNIIDKGRGCASYVGMQKMGAQEVFLGDGCYYIGTIVHELGHAIGVYHEHQRSDRDEYITIYRKNVTRGVLNNFDINDSDDEIVTTAYDYNSIMHYGNYAFSKDPDNLMTMEAKNGQKLLEPHDKPGLTNRDIDIVRKLYKC